MLEKSKSSRPNITMKELKAVKSLRLNKEIRILQADKGNCTVVLDESKYKDKLNTLLESGVYETLPKDPTAKVERKVQKLLSKYKTTLPSDLKHRLTPYHSKPPHLYGLPKIHKADIPLRPIVSSIGSPCYALAGFLHKILSPFAGKSDSFVKNSAHFIQLLKTVNLHSQDTLVSFDIVSLSTNVPVNEVLHIIENKLHDDVTLAERSVLQVGAIMELLEVCLRTTYFQVDDKFFQQKDGMAMGNSLSPIVSNIFMEHFEKLALDSTPYKPSLWLRYVDDTFVVWPHGPERLQTFFDHLNSLRPSICFTMETESNNAISFLDVLVIREKTALATQVYRKPTHTGQYLNFNSNHPPHVKRGLIKSLHDRASTICQDRRDLVREINNLRHDLQLNGYPKGFIDSVINSKGSSRPKKEESPLCSVYIPHVKGVSEKFKRIGNRYTIRTIFHTKHTLKNSLMKTRPKRDPQQMAQCVYSILCECGRSYIGKTGRPLAVRLRKHRHNVKEGLLEKSKLAQHAYEEGHRVGWDEAKILDIESHIRYRKYKEAAHMACSANPISQPSLDFSPIWIPIISNEVTNSHRRSV
ncbi:hypothetical protein B7P43_G14177 [Cryptotermes secundus]|nr:hypothetical protein B7P43_G14177 [Cryptotermes secundus]